MSSKVLVKPIDSKDNAFIHVNTPSVLELVGSDLEKQFALLNSGSDADDELAAMKAQIGSSPKPLMTLTSSEWAVAAVGFCVLLLGSGREHWCQLNVKLKGGNRFPSMPPAP